MTTSYQTLQALKRIKRELDHLPSEDLRELGGGEYSVHFAVTDAIEHLEWAIDFHEQEIATIGENQ